MPNYNHFKLTAGLFPVLTMTNCTKDLRRD